MGKWIVLNVVIIGAGIAGVTTAAALDRAGVPYQIYEQAGELGEVGAGVQLAPNSTRLLQRLPGIRLADRAVTPSAIRMHHWESGDMLATTMLGQACLERYGAPYYTFHRADLHRLLRDLVPAEKVALSQRCVGVKETSDGAEVSFADGSTVTADVVVGADGIHSEIRKLMADDHPSYSGQSIFRGLVPADRVPHLSVNPKVNLWVGPGRHCVAYAVAGGELVNLVATTPTDGWVAESWTTPGSVEELRAAYEGWAEDVQLLLAEVDRVTQWALHDREPVETWSSDRVTLVGDAAHPMLPFAAQGANQAIEDAFVLAECLKDATTDTIPEALKRYEAIRQPRAADVQRRSRTNMKQFHQTDDERRPDDGEENLQAQAALFGYDAEEVARSAPR
jgi:salicylate hydroxylase